MDEKQIEEIDELETVLYEANHKKSVLDYRWLATEAYNAGYRKQKEGEWIAKDNFDGRCSIATCSNCGTEKAFSILVKIETVATLYPYCQMCGTKMKGGKVAAKKFFSPEDVCMMSLKEVKENYRDIQRSMKRWK